MQSEAPVPRALLAGVLSLLLCALAARADISLAEAHVGLTILNTPPHLASLALLPLQPTAYDTLRCVGDIRDNSPETATLEVEWIGPEGVLSTESGLVPRGHGLSAGDEVRCIAHARDSEGAVSSTLEVSAVLAEGGIAEALAFYVRDLAGIGQDDGAGAAEDGGMAAITGFAAGSPSSGGTASLLVVAFVVLLSVNLLLLARRLRGR